MGLLDPGFRCNPGCLYQVPGARYQVSRHQATRYLVPGTRYLVPRTWNQVPGTWNQVPGTRYLVHVPGTWCLVPGTMHLVPGSDEVSGSELSGHLSGSDESQDRSTRPNYRTPGSLGVPNLTDFRWPKLPSEPDVRLSGSQVHYQEPSLLVEQEDISSC